MKKNKKLTTRQKKALETKELIFKTSIRLILERGFHKVHIEDISREAGTSIGLFYKYFKSKDEIVVEHYKSIDDIYKKAYEQLDKSKSSTEKLLIVFEAGFSFSENLGKEFLGVLFSNQFSLRGSNHGYVMNQDRIIYRVIHEIVEEGTRSEEFRNDLSIDTIVSMLFRAYTGSYFEWTLMDNKSNLTEDGIEFIRLFIDAAIKSKNRLI